MFAFSATGDDFKPTDDNADAELLMGLVHADDLERAADALFDFAHDAIVSRRLVELNDLVEALEPSVGVSLDFSVAVLTATFPVKSRLPARPHFSDAIQRAFPDDESVPVMLLGLC